MRELELAGQQRADMGGRGGCIQRSVEVGFGEPASATREHEVHCRPKEAYEAYRARGVMKDGRRSRGNANCLRISRWGVSGLRRAWRRGVKPMYAGRLQSGRPRRLARRRGHADAAPLGRRAT